MQTLFLKEQFSICLKKNRSYITCMYTLMYFFYCILITGAYLISSWINFINIGKKNLSYVVVLGCGLNKRKIIPLLAGRINKGKQCGQNSSVEFLIYTMNQCKKLTDKPLLVRLDSVNNSIDNVAVLIENGCYFVIKRNLRKESSLLWV